MEEKEQARLNSKLEQLGSGWAPIIKKANDLKGKLKVATLDDFCKFMKRRDGTSYEQHAVGKIYFLKINKDEFKELKYKIDGQFFLDHLSQWLSERKVYVYKSESKRKEHEKEEDLFKTLQSDLLI